ncbi:flagellar export chaperone FlgN [Anaerosalibacter massiliensis]|uniref:Flagellar protein FlgN n=1 Tax=Anaerosalibacter massiliensis TaxID=1347392 RepID=A0A9X2S5P7_9FIRM|nr:flagellar export chaperone FlgN [Anaerosalibacter massiliensis]MCR2044773.1 flagellar protein FlgN [Anaerosalibacter massiliensis]
MTKELIDEIVNISEKKLEYLYNMLELTKFQREYIDEGNMIKTDEILEKKDELIKKIDKLDIEFLIKFSELKKKHNVDDINELDINVYPNLKILKDIIKNISSTLMSISILDDENNKYLKNSLEKIKSDLKKLKKGKKAYKGYNKSIEESIFIDEKK